jgi:hypothetical protein
MKASQHPADGDTRRCPQCRNTLVFSSRYPVLAVGMGSSLPRPAKAALKSTPLVRTSRRAS